MIHGQPPMPPEDPRDRFARVIREAREQRNWTQDDLAEQSGVSRPTIQRYEGGKTATPEPEKARLIFSTLGLEPRLIPVLLGYVTAEEMGVDPVPPRVLSSTAEEALGILENPRVSAEQKAEWLRYLRYLTQAATAEKQANQAG